MITLKELQQAFPATQEETLTKVLQVILGTFDSEQLEAEFTDCKQLAYVSYSAQSYTHMQMIALNQLLEGHGIEAIEHDDKHYSYVNMGDTYNVTIIDNGALILTDCGTFIEELEQESGVQCK